MNAFCSQLNYWAVLVSTFAYFMLGWLWFGALFGKMWMAEHERLGKKIEMKPTSSSMMLMMGSSVLGAFVVSAATAFVVYRFGVSTAVSGLKIGCA